LRGFVLASPGIDYRRRPVLNHYKSTTGYALLYVILLAGTIFLTGMFAGLTRALGLEAAPQIAGIIIFAAFWVLGFMVMQRFLKIENRIPTLWESNLVGLKSVLVVIGTLVLLSTFITITVLPTQILGGGDGGGGRGASGGGGGMTEAQQLQAIKGLLGVLGTFVLLYAAPFLNMAILSRFFGRKTKAA